MQSGKLNKAVLAVVFFIFLGCNLQATEKADTLQIEARINNQRLQLNNWIVLSDTDSILIESFKFYISNFVLYSENNDTVGTAVNNHKLLDLSSQSSMSIAYKIDADNYQKIRFNLGIDSITNVSGVFGGDLDPTNGMYWTWQSGYVNLKLEGLSPLSAERKNKFQYHIGGYAFPFDAMQEINLEKKNDGAIKLIVDLNVLLSKIDIVDTPNVMSPNANAMKIAQVFEEMFKIKYED